MQLEDFPMDAHACPLKFGSCKSLPPLRATPAEASGPRARVNPAWAAVCPRRWESDVGRTRLPLCRPVPRPGPREPPPSRSSRAGVARRSPSVDSLSSPLTSHVASCRGPAPTTQVPGPSRSLSPPRSHCRASSLLPERSVRTATLSRSCAGRPYFRTSASGVPDLSRQSSVP